MRCDFDRAIGASFLSPWPRPGSGPPHRPPRPNGVRYHGAPKRVAPDRGPTGRHPIGVPNPGRCPSNPGRCPSNPGRCPSNPGRCPGLRDIGPLGQWRVGDDRAVFHSSRANGASFLSLGHRPRRCPGLRNDAPLGHGIGAVGIMAGLYNRSPARRARGRNGWCCG